MVVHAHVPLQRHVVKWSPRVLRAPLALHHATQHIHTTIPPIAWAFSDVFVRSLPTLTMGTTIPAVGGNAVVCYHFLSFLRGQE